MTRAKPCLSCSHPKSRHKSWRGKGYCIHSHDKRGQTFNGVQIVSVYCTCDGYQGRDETPGEEES